MIRALVCGYHADLRGRKLLVAVSEYRDFQAFADDSAGHETPLRPLVLAAYALPAEHWAAFSDDWHTALHMRPEINYLKMSEAEGFDGEFLGMRSRPEFRELKLNDLCAVIRKYRPYAMYSRLNRSEYEQIVQDRIPSEPDSPYFLAMLGLIELCLQAQERYNYWGPVDFIFDEQSGIEEQVQRAFRAAKEAQPPHLQRLLGKVPVFRNDVEMKPIQAADMLAWHIRRHLERPDEVRARMADLLCGGHCEKEYDALALRAVLLKWAGEFMRHIKETKPHEFSKFDKLMRQLIAVPHSEIKAKLDAEKAAKKRKPKTSASGRASRDSGGRA